MVEAEADVREVEREEEPKWSDRGGASGACGVPPSDDL